jgi:hypothetical protein
MLKFVYEYAIGLIRWEDTDTGNKGGGKQQREQRRKIGKESMEGTFSSIPRTREY